jgi:hypothetical protein
VGGTAWEGGSELIVVHFSGKLYTIKILTPYRKKMKFYTLTEFHFFTSFLLNYYLSIKGAVANEARRTLCHSSIKVLLV